MNTDLRLSLSAARERDKATEHEPFDVKWDCPLLQHKPGWTPAPDHIVSVNKMVVAPKRDYEAILRAAKRKPVGYWEDAPKGEPFTSAPEPAVAVLPPYFGEPFTFGANIERIEHPYTSDHVTTRVKITATRGNSEAYGRWELLPDGAWLVLSRGWTDAKAKKALVAYADKHLPILKEQLCPPKTAASLSAYASRPAKPSTPSVPSAPSVATGAR